MEETLLTPCGYFCRSFVAWPPRVTILNFGKELSTHRFSLPFLQVVEGLLSVRSQPNHEGAGTYRLNEASEGLAHLLRSGASTAVGTESFAHSSHLRGSDVLVLGMIMYTTGRGFVTKQSNGDRVQVGFHEGYGKINPLVVRAQSTGVAGGGGYG